MIFGRKPIIPARAAFTLAKAVRKAKPGQIEQVEALARKMEPVIAKAILAHLSELQASVDLQDLIDALTKGDIESVVAMLAGFQGGAGAGAVADALEDAVWGGAAIASLQINARIGGVTFAFDRLNPTLVAFLRGYSLRLIREIDTSTREAVRSGLVAGLAQGQGPIDTARDVRGSIGLTKRQAAAVKAYRKELESFHTRKSAKGFGLGQKIDRVNGRQVFKPDDMGNPKDGILERRLRDFRYDSRLSRAMATGKPIPPEQIDKMVAAYQRKYLRYRSEMIARTESLRAANYGVQDAWRQVIETGAMPEDLVRRQWKVARDERLCEICAPIPGMNPKLGVKFSEAFATPQGPTMLPPIHPACRCAVFIRQYEPEQLE